jgi:hypothetical protein
LQKISEVLLPTKFYPNWLILLHMGSTTQSPQSPSFKKKSHLPEMIQTGG